MSDFQAFNGDFAARGVEAGATIMQNSRYNNGVSTSFTKTLVAAEISGTASAGSVRYTFCAAFGTATAVTTLLSLQTTSGVMSNVISVTMSKPVGALKQSEVDTAWETDR